MRLLKHLSLRTRLSLLYAILLIFSVLIVGCYSYWNIWQLFVKNKSTHIRARAKPIIEQWLRTNHLDKTSSPKTITPQNAFMLACDLTSRDTVAIILNLKGKIIASGKRLPEEPIPPSPKRQYIQQALAGENEITYRDDIKGKPMLVVLIPLRPHPGSSKILGVIQMSSLLGDINKILFQHGTMLLSLISIILLSGIALGFGMISINLKELQSLANSCEKISEGDFSQQVEITNHSDEIGQLALSFNQMANRLKTIFASQQRFVTNAAHELMTPLTGLQGSLEVLLRGAQDDPLTRDRLLKGMYREVRRLIRLCDQLLGLSRLENIATLHKQTIILTDFFKEFESDAKILAKGRSLLFTQGPYTQLFADPDLLKQILLNLLSNALKFSSKDKPVTIGWKLLPRKVKIWVSDKGEGIDPKILPHIFEPFYQKSPKTISNHKGIGLGLSLTKSMIEAHGGTIWVESKPGQGTTVFFTLPKK